MISVRMYQDERQLAWGYNNILQIQLFIAQSGFDPQTSGLWAQPRFLCGTLLNKDGIYVITNDEILIFIYIVFAINKQKLAACEDPTHDLQIMALTLCLLR